MDGLLINVSCPLCGEKNNIPYTHETRVFGKEKIRLGLNKCKVCTLNYVSPRLSSDALFNLYNHEYQTATLSGANHTDDEVSKYEYERFAFYLTKHLPDGGKILDLGCGTGNLLFHLKDLHQFETTGIEFSMEASEKAIKRGLNVLQNNLHGAEFKEESFDAVMLLYVLEHLYEPKQTLLEIHRILKKDSYLFIAVPNYRYLKVAFDNPIVKRIFGQKATLHPEEHLQNFTPDTLKHILKDTGFNVCKEYCTRPLANGSPVIRLAKNGMYFFVKILSLMGFNIGGIHLIAQKK